MSSKKLFRTAIEFNLTEHCNLRCAGCDHASQLLPERFAELGSFRRDFEALGGVMHAGELKLLGGEPLMHPQLRGFLEAAHEVRVADRITLVTNGVLLHQVEESLFDLVDKLWVSVYPGVRIRTDLRRLRRIGAERGFELEVLEVREFRTTLVNKPHDDAALVQEIYRSCGLAHRWSCHTVRDGYYYLCPPAALLEPRLELLGAAVPDRVRDGVPLHDNPTLRQDLQRYLERSQALAACTWCLGTSGGLHPHRQLRPDEIRQALSGEQPAPGRLVELTMLQRVRLAARRALAPWRARRPTAPR